MSVAMARALNVVWPAVFFGRVILSVSRCLILVVGLRTLEKWEWWTLWSWGGVGARLCVIDVDVDGELEKRGNQTNRGKEAGSVYKVTI